MNHSETWPLGRCRRGLFVALILGEASTPALDFGMVKFVLALVLETRLFTALSREAGHRKTRVVSDAWNAEMVAFPPRPAADRRW